MKGFSLAKKASAARESSRRVSSKAPPAGSVCQVFPAGLAGQTIEEILQNGRSANRLKCWVLAATGSPQARKNRERQNHPTFFSILVSDGKMDAVITCLGRNVAKDSTRWSFQAAKANTLPWLHWAQALGILEWVCQSCWADVVLTIEVVADGEGEGVPPPSFLPLQQLAEVGDWASVNIQGRVLEIMPGGDFKVVDDCGVAVRVHAELARLPQLQEGQKSRSAACNQKAADSPNVLHLELHGHPAGGAAGSRSCGPCLLGSSSPCKVVDASPMAATWGVRFGMCQGGKRFPVVAYSP